MSSMEEKLQKTRRDFVKKVGLMGAASLAGGAALVAGYAYEKKKGKDQLITTVDEQNRLVHLKKSEIAGLKPDLEALQARGREGLKGRKWIMVIDLAKCRNARQCIAGCQSAHHLRPHEYHINTLVMQDSPNTAPYYMPKPCQHCDNPPCVSVCPVDATFKRQDGIVLIDNERCIGCRFCIAACPYSARMFHWQEPLRKEEYADGLFEGQPYDIEKNVPQKKGTISKCVLSADRLREGKLPYCVSACPNGVFYFGDEYEDAVTNGTTKETVRLSTLLRDKAGYRLMPELGTEPRVYYLPPKDRLFEAPDLNLIDQLNAPHA